ncbi:MAG: TIM barrel protein [Asticcacaulis sp.]
MLRSIATVCLSGSLPEKLHAIAQAGFQGVEIFENDLMVSDLSPAEIRQRMTDLGLVCTCYQPFRDFEGLSGPLRQQAFERARRKFDLMQQLEADLLLVCSSVSEHASDNTEHIINDFRELGDIARDHGVRVGYEALAWGRHINDHRQAWDIVKQTDHPNIGLILDTFHSLSRNIPIESLKDIDSEKLFLIQLADAPLVRMDYLYWSRHFRCFPGQGDFDITGYVSTLIEQGYRGPLSHEIFNDRFRAWSAPQIATDGYRSLAWLEDTLRTALPAKEAPPALPAPVRPLAIRFVEFTASGAEADELRHLISQLGFVLTGTHRSKQVTLWQQGETDIIINEDPKGFAYAYQVTHGASVCALGLSLEHPEDALKRAQALGIDQLEQPVADGERNIPAVRAVGGTLIYLIEPEKQSPYWHDDFLPVPPSEAKSPEPLLTRIDHIAHSMPVEEFLSWQLYYTALFDVARTSPVDIIDPLGLVQSQALETPDKVMRVTLNGGSGHTLTSRFVSHFFGSGIQHIAFATTDIFALAARLQQNGVAQLELPDNYYEDLSARFAIAPDILAKMKEFGILYDEDAHGTYYQLYSRAFKRRFFFEIVQRTDYAGYGAANAPVRLAAQARYTPVP